MANESLERLADSRVPQFVPLFVGRFTRDRIKQIVTSARGARASRSQGEAEAEFA
jgi:hypothetical protein